MQTECLLSDCTTRGTEHVFFNLMILNAQSSQSFTQLLCMTITVVNLKCCKFNENRNLSNKVCECERQHVSSD